MGGKYIFTQNTFNQSPIGDNATVIVQGWGSNDLRKFAEDLLKLQPEIEKKATSPEAQQDAKIVDSIRQEAAKGNKSGVIEQIKKLGKWGWETLKELGVSVAVEALKQATGI
jgi:hypothetical protein